MRVKKIEPLSVAYPEPNDNGATRYLTLCRVEGDDGTVGWGESVTMWPAVCRATEQLIEGFAEDVVGVDVLDNVEIWRSLRRQGWWYGYRGGLVSFAISAIDIALWDLRGKSTGQSLLTMLGGPARSRLPVIASTHAFHADLDEEVAVHRGYVDAGFQGVKIGFGKRGEARLGYEFDRDVSFVRHLRDALGPSASIMIDRGQSLAWDLDHAVRLTNAMNEQKIRWIEEPFEPHEWNSYQSFRRRVSTMIGTGEREWDEQGYRQLIESGVVDVVGCDPGRAQGITGARRAIGLVEDAGLWFNAHTWSSAIVTAASLALSLSTDRTLLLELKPMENPMQHELVANPFVPVEGWILARSEPGLGIEVDESVVNRYRISGT